jgi:hypothetical protein
MILGTSYGNLGLFVGAGFSMAVLNDPMMAMEIALGENSRRAREMRVRCHPDAPLPWFLIGRKTIRPFTSMRLSPGPALSIAGALVGARLCAL